MKLIRSGAFPVVLFLSATAFILLAASAAQAQSGSESAALFGNFGQGNSAVVSSAGQSVANMACVPTATVNGLDYLYDYQLSISQPAPLSFAPSYTSVNNLIGNMGTTANGTFMGSAANGLKSYMSPTGANPAPTVSISGQYTAITYGGTSYATTWYTGINSAGTFANVAPTASFLANALNANDGVEFTLWWGPNNGAHELTLESINMNNGGTNGTISFLDPWGNSQVTMTATNAGSSATLLTGTVSISSGFLFVTYPTNNSMSGLEPDPEEEDNNEPGDANGQVGIMIADMVEAVPEPTSFALVGAAAVIGLGARIIRRRKDRW